MIDLDARACALNERGALEPTPVETVLARARRYRNRRRVATAVVTTVVAVSGVVAIAWATGNRGRANDVHTVDSTVAPSPDPHDAALALADRLLEGAQLPKGATRFDRTPPAIIDHPWESESTPNLADVSRVFIVPTPVAAVLAFVPSHPPAGFAPGQCCGASGGPTYRIDNVTFDAPTTPFPATGPIVSAQVLVSATARTATTTWVRVDAQVVWRPRRDAATLAAAKDRVVTITGPEGPAKPRQIVVTDGSTVDRLARELNAMPTSPSFTSNGPCDEREYTVRFVTSRSARPDLTAHISCGYAQVIGSGGHSVLLSGGAFIDDVDALFIRRQ